MTERRRRVSEPFCLMVQLLAKLPLVFASQLSHVPSARSPAFFFSCISSISWLNPIAYTTMPLVLELGMRTEVNKQSEPHARGFQVVENLGTVLVSKLLDRLYLNDDLLKTNEVGLVKLLQRSAIVDNLKFALGQKWNSPLGELDFQAFLVDRLQESPSHALIDPGSTAPMILYDSCS